MPESNASQKCLHGYRIAFFPTCGYPYRFFEDSLTENDAEVFQIGQEQPGEEGLFKLWWQSEVDRARIDRVTLILADNICHCGREKCSLGILRRSWLQSVEEEDFYKNHSSRPVRMTTRKKLYDVIYNRNPKVVDTWGDCIEKGQCADSTTSNRGMEEERRAS